MITAASPFLPNHTLPRSRGRSGLDQKAQTGALKLGFEPNRGALRLRPAKSGYSGKPLATKVLHHRNRKPKTMGVTYYTYRYYDPLTGRWPSRDPIEEEGGVNLYGFVKNDPIKDYDYLGFCTKGESRIDSESMKPVSAADSEDPDKAITSGAGKFLNWLLKLIAGAGDRARPPVPNALDGGWGWEATVKYSCCRCKNNELGWVSEKELTDHGEPFVNEAAAKHDGEQGLSDLKEQVTCE